MNHHQNFIKKIVLMKKVNQPKKSMNLVLMEQNLNILMEQVLYQQKHMKMEQKSVMATLQTIIFLKSHQQLMALKTQTHMAIALTP